MARSSWHYRTHPRKVAAPVPQAQRAYPTRLGQQERARVVELLGAAAQGGASVHQAWYQALDSGQPVASASTWYRIARQEGVERVTRRRKRRRATAMPQWDAAGANQVWCWDITKLPGKHKGQWLNLYCVIDAFSRKVMAWRVEEDEVDELARDMFEQAFARHGAHPRVVHSDNGASMVSEALTSLLRDLEIDVSRNRPRVSNDNPHIESLFKTLKHSASYPPFFEDLDHARTWAAERIEWYNTSHAHSNLAGHTPQPVHDGSWATIHQQRQATLQALAAKHPNRYRRAPNLKEPPTRTQLNPPPQNDQECLQTA